MLTTGKFNSDRWKVLSGENDAIEMYAPGELLREESNRGHQPENVHSF